jgi:hypothetical protein
MTSFESNYSDAVEVNGVSFRIEMHSLIPIPKLPGGKTPVRLGIGAKNNTSTRLIVPLEEQSPGMGWVGRVTLPFVSFRLGC